MVIICISLLVSSICFTISKAVPLFSTQIVYFYFPCHGIGSCNNVKKKIGMGIIKPECFGKLNFLCTKSA